MSPELIKEQFISSSEAAKLFDYTPDYIARLCREGKVKSVRVGRTWLVDKTSLEAYRIGEEERRTVVAQELSQVRVIEYRTAQEAKRIPSPFVAFSRMAVPLVLMFTVGVLSAGAFFMRGEVASSFAQVRTGLTAASGNVFEGTAAFTYRTISSLFDRAGSVIASWFPTSYVALAPIEVREQGVVATSTAVIVTAAMPSNVTNQITNDYHLTVNGISRESIDARIRDHIDNLNDQIDSGGGSGDGSVTSVDASGGTTGLAFTGGPVTSTGTLTLSGTLAATNGGTGQTSFAVGDILYADTTTTLAKLPVGSAGQVLKVAAGLPSWSADLQGSGGAGAWATTSDSLAVYPSTVTNVVLIGASATTTTGNILEVAGSVLFRNALIAYGTVSASNFSATTTAVNTFPNLLATNATTTSLGINSETFTDLTGAGLQNVGGALTLNATGDWTGTFDGQEGSYYLARANHTGTQLASTISDFSSTARGLFSSTATGLTYTSGTGAFSLTSGYTIPLTASTTEWDSAYANRITSATYPLQFSSNILSLAFGTTTSNTWGGTQTFTNPITVVSTTATSTLPHLTGSFISGFGLSECADAGDKLLWNNGTFSCGADAGAGGGITAIGAEYSSFQNGSSQTLATSSDTNIGLTITSAANVHTFTPTWIGTLAAGRGGTGLSSVSANQILIGNTSGTGWTQMATSSLGLPTFATLAGYFSLSDWYATTTDGLAQGITNRYYSDTLARGAFSSTATGLTYTSGTGVFSLTGGYNIPLTASTTNWNAFYDTPSSRISVSGNLAWSGNTLGVAAGYTIPLTASTTEWDTAFSWGNHATAGYALSSSLFAYPFPSNATSTLLSFNGGASTTQLTTTGTTYLATIGGRVGVGTTTPTGILHVAAVGAADADDLFKVTEDGNDIFNVDARDGATLRTGSSRYLNITRDGTATISIGNNATIPDIVAADGLGLLLRSREDGVGAPYGVAILNDVALPSGVALLKVGIGTTDATTEYFRVSDIGNVGISTTSPSERLSVQGNQYTSGTAFFGGAVTATSTVTLSNYTNGALGVTSAGALYTFSTSTWTFASSTLLADNNTFSGNNTFSNTITGSITGNAGTATALQTARTINGVSFNGTADITVTAASSTLLTDNNIFGGSNAYGTPSSITLTNATNLPIIGGTTGTLTVARGGTGTTTAPSGQVLYGGGAGVYQSVATTSATIGAGLSYSGTLGALLGGASGTLSLNATGDWTGTFDGLEGAAYLANSFSTTSAQYFVHSSTTIPKTYTTNTFTNANVFNGGVTISSLNGPLQANAGVVSATTSVGAVYGGTGQTSYVIGDILYADTTGSLAKLPIGTAGQVLKVTGGLPQWGVDLTTGGGGGAGAWSTTTDSLAIYPTDTSNVVIVGNSATTTTTSIFEVSGRSYFSNNLSIATTSTANRLTVDGTTLLGGLLTLYSGFNVGAETFTDLTGTGLQNVGGALTLNATGDWTGTFDGQEGSFYLSRANHTGTQAASTISDFDAAVNSYINASTTIPKTYTTNTFSALQTFNAGITSNALTLGTLNGPLQANAGVVSATSSIGVLYGGTGLTSAPAYGNILVGNAGGGYTLTATSSLGLITAAVQNIGPAGQTADGPTVTLATSTASFNGLTTALTVVGSGDTLTLTPSLSGTLDNAGLTNSTISGIALGANLADLTAGNSSLTFSGSYNGSTARTVSLNTANANSWSALQSFTNASSTLFSNTGTAYFGGTATTTIASTGAITTPATLTVSSGGVAVTGNSTITGTLGSLTGLTSSGTITFSSLTGGLLYANGSGVLSSVATSTWTFASSTLLADNNTFSGNNTFSNTITGSITGNAGTATALQTARTINGVSFNGTADITVTAASSTLLANNNTFSGTNSFTGNMTLASATSTNLFSSRLTANTAAFGQTGSTTIASTGALSTPSLTVGSLTGLLYGTNGAVSAVSTSTWTFASSTLLADNNTFSGNNTFSNTITGSITGNAGTATALQTARTINGVSFNGTADITVTAASSTLLANNNTFSGTNSFTGNMTLASATSTNLFSSRLTANTAAFGQTGSTTIASTGALSTPSLTVGSLSGVLYGVSGVTNAVATSTLSLSTGLSYSGTLGSLVGGSSGTLSVATSSLFTGTQGQVAYFDGTNSLVGTSSLFVATSGRLGVGLTNPATSIETTGEVRAQLGLSLYNNRSISNANAGQRMQFNSDGSMAIYTTGGSEYTRFTNNGTVGIGTTTPASTLSVQGNQYTSGAAFFGGALTATSTANISGLTTFGAGVNVNAETFTDLTGTGLTNTAGVLTLNATGDWTGTFDGQEGSFYLARANHTGTQLAATISDFDTALNSYIHSSTTIPKTYTTNTFTGAQTFTGGVTSNALTLGTLNGPLQANAGVVSATTSIGVLYGGTGLTAAPAYGQVLVGQADGSYLLTATSSLGFTGGTNYLTNSGAFTYLSTGRNFGIGTSSPYARLSIHGSAMEPYTPYLFAIGSSTSSFATTTLFSIAANGVATFGDSSGTGDASVQFGADTNAWSLGYETASKSFIIASSTDLSSDIALAITKGGSVGIATTTPTQTLSVQGNQYTSGTAFFGGAITATSSVTLANYTNGALGVSSTGALYTFSTSTWSFASSTLLANNNTWSGTNTFSNTLTANSTLDANGVVTLGDNGDNITIDSNVWDITAAGVVSGLTGLTSTGNISLANATSTNLFSSRLTANTAAFGQTGSTTIASTGALSTPSATIGSLSGALYGVSGAVNAVATSSITALGTGLSYSGTLGSLLGGSSGTLSIATSSLFTGTTGQVPYFNGTNSMIGTSSLFISTAGRIGVGTSSPGTNLDIYSTGTADLLRLLRVGGSGGLSFNGDNGLGIITGTPIATAGSYGLGFEVTAAGVISEAMRISSAGQLLVGTTSSPTIRTTIASGADANLALVANANGKFWGFDTINADGRLRIANGVNGEVLSVSEGGNVGIASTTPYAKLSITNTGTDPSFVIEDSTSPDTTPLLVDASGNMALGTTTPSKKLVVAVGNAGSLSNGLLVERGTGGYNGVQYGLKSDSSGQYRGAISIFGASGTEQESISISTGGAGVGFVGMGTTTPDTLLHLAGNAAAGTGNTNYLRLSELDTTIVAGQSWGIDFYSLDATAPDISSGYVRSVAVNAGSQFALAFGSANGAAATEALRVDFDGNIGIGTTTPAAKLDVYAASGVGLYVEAGAGGVDIANFSRRNGAIADVTITAPGGDSAIIFGTNGTDRYGIGYDNSAGTFAIADGGALGTTNRLVIDSAGDVGIGTSSPGYTLDVYGGIRTHGWGDATAGNIIFGGAATETIYGGSSAQILALYTAGTEKVRLTSTGNLGIGTTSPYAKLSVAGPVVAEYFHGTSTTASTFGGNINVGGTSQQYVGFSTGGNALALNASTGTGLTSTASIFMNIDSNNDDTTRFFAVGNNNVTLGSATELFRIQENGNVGIGSTSPNTHLVIHDSTYSNGTLFTQLTMSTAQNVWNGGAGSGNLIAWKGFNDSAVGALGGYGSATNVYGLAFWGGANTGSPHMMLTNSGNVGIGTTSPNATLDIVSSGGSATPGSANLLELGSSGTAKFGFRKDTSFSALQLDRLVGTTWTNVMTWDRNSGYVGISTSSPGYPLSLDRSDTGIFFASTRAGVEKFNLYSSSVTSQITAANGNDLRFGLATGSGLGTAYLSIITGGNVGVGDVTPAALFTVGNGDLFQVNSSGAIAAATGITSSGTITFSGLTANRLVTTTTGGALTNTITLANLVASVSDITSSTGTTNLVLSASPTFTGTITAAAATLSSTLTANGTFAANGVVTIGDNGDNVTINSNVWDITAAGVVSGLTGLTSTGNISLANATSTNLFASSMLSANQLRIGGTSTTTISTTGAIVTPVGITVTGNSTITGTLTALTGLTTSGTLTGSVGTFSSTLTANSTLDANGVVTLGDNGDNITLDSSVWDISSAGVASGFTGITTTGTLSGAVGTFSSTLTANSTFAANGAVTLGDNGDNITIDSNVWDVTAAGVASGLTGITSSGTITFSGLTANRLVTTTTGGALTNTITLANLVASVSDITSSTGTTNLVLSASPTFTGTITAAAATLSSTLTANGTFAANGVVTIGDNGDNITIDSNVWDVTAAGVASGLTGITSSGTASFATLTMSGQTFSNTNATNMLVTGLTDMYFDLDNDNNGSNQFIIRNGADSNILTLTEAGLLTTSGDISVGGGTGKITVGTIDPVYTVNGVAYSTYGTGMIGIKEEVVGTAQITTQTTASDGTKGYVAVLDFDAQEAGSDLWLFAQTTHLRKHIDELVVLLTAEGGANVWYEVDEEDRKVYILSNKPTRVSYRLTAPRFDAAEWSNYNHDGILGFLPPSDDELSYFDEEDIEFSFDPASLFSGTTTLATLIEEAQGADVEPWAGALFTVSDGLKDAMAVLSDSVIQTFEGVQYFADGIFARIFAGEIYADKFCVTDENGETCLTRSQLDALIAGAAAAQNSGNNGGSQGGGDEPPADEPPADEPPADEPPADEPPADAPPADEPPSEEPVTEEPPADEPPADEPPADEPPADEPPADESSDEESLATGA